MLQLLGLGWGYIPVLQTCRFELKDGWKTTSLLIIKLLFSLLGIFVAQVEDMGNNAQGDDTRVNYLAFENEWSRETMRVESHVPTLEIVASACNVEECLKTIARLVFITAR